MPGVSKLLNLLIYMAIGASGEIWPLDRPENMPAINSLEVMCGKDHMDVHLSFSHPFEGIVSSKGQHGDPHCVYVPPSTGQTFFSFRIAYTRCGTKPDMHGQFYENTVVVQYDKDLLEVWDEAKRLRCEWFNDYEKTASKPPMVIADLDVVQLDFRGDNVDCWMEIQHGKGPWASPVSGIVPLGSTLTLVVAINDFGGEFDMRVKSCVASDGGGHLIQLSDEFGCVLRPKMISRFLKARGVDDRATVVTYAFFHAFKFPDALSVHIKCKVEICRRGCPGQCQPHGSSGHHLQERNDDHLPFTFSHQTTAAASRGDDTPLYDDIVKDDDHLSSIVDKKDDKSAPEVQAQIGHRPPAPVFEPQEELAFSDPSRTAHDDPEADEEFPQGPRNLEKEDPALTPVPASTTRTRWKRTVRKSPRSDIGVNGIYEVISEADLAFSPDSRAEAVTVFRGKIEEDVVYGICLPMPGLNALFVIVGLSAVLSALVAGAMLHRVQKTRTKRPGAIESTDAGLAFRMFGSRCSGRARHPSNPGSMERR